MDRSGAKPRLRIKSKLLCCPWPDELPYQQVCGRGLLISASLSQAAGLSVGSVARISRRSIQPCSYALSPSNQSANEGRKVLESSHNSSFAAECSTEIPNDQDEILASVVGVCDDAEHKLVKSCRNLCSISSAANAGDVGQIFAFATSSVLHALGCIGQLKIVHVSILRHSQSWNRCMSSLHQTQSMQSVTNSSGCEVGPWPSCPLVPFASSLLLQLIKPPSLSGEDAKGSEKRRIPEVRTEMLMDEACSTPILIASGDIVSVPCAHSWDALSPFGISADAAGCVSVPCWQPGQVAHRSGRVLCLAKNVKHSFSSGAVEEISGVVCIHPKITKLKFTVEPEDCDCEERHDLLTSKCLPPWALPLPTSAFWESPTFSELVGYLLGAEDHFHSLGMPENDKKCCRLMLVGEAGSGRCSLLQLAASATGQWPLFLKISPRSLRENACSIRRLISSTETTSMSSVVVLMISNDVDTGASRQGERDWNVSEALISAFCHAVEDCAANMVLICDEDTSSIPYAIRSQFPHVVNVQTVLGSEFTQIQHSGTSSNAIPKQTSLPKKFLDVELLRSKSALLGSDKAMQDYESQAKQGLGCLVEQPDVSFKDVGGCSRAVERVLDVLKGSGNHVSRDAIGVLLFGPPGTGKTLIAKAVAGSAGLNFMAVNGPELLDMYIGESERKVRKLFADAKHASPCVIFFDEIDALAPARSGGHSSGTDRVVSQLLTEMDSVRAFNKAGGHHHGQPAENASSKSIIVLGATNRPDLLDASLLRPGRFDSRVLVPPPSTVQERCEILQACSRRCHVSQDVNWQLLADNCPALCTGAEIAGAIQAAWLAAFKRAAGHSETAFSGSDVQPWNRPDSCNSSSLEISSVEITHCDILQSLRLCTPTLTREQLSALENLERL